MLSRIVDSARQRALNPALRVRDRSRRRPVEVLGELGFDADELEAFDAAYEDAVDELFPLMIARSRELGDPTDKLEDREHPGHDSKRLVYLATRCLRPRVAVETGTFKGNLSVFVLKALQQNGVGRLISLDLPAYAPIPRAIDTALPSGQQPGWIIPDELRDRFQLVLGDARKTLPAVLQEHRPLELFIHDSLHTTRHMLFEYRAAWRALAPGGVLISDDVFVTPAYYWWAKRHRRPLRWVGGGVGVCRRP